MYITWMGVFIQWNILIDLTIGLVTFDPKMSINSNKMENVLYFLY